jgi:hypothetical protein
MRINCNFSHKILSYAHSKSLTFYARRFNPATLSRATLLNLKHDGNVHNYPLYAISLFPKLSLTTPE